MRAKSLVRCRVTLTAWVTFAACPCLILPVVTASGQTDPASLPPSEAYKDAMAPFAAARAQPDDLTDADRFALGIGINKAARSCMTLSTDLQTLGTNAKELLALGELCIFGQQFAPAQSALVAYLALPQPQERKLALVLLIRALLGLDVPDGAELQVDSLLRDYPYDAQTHFAIDQVIDAEEAGSIHRLHALPHALKDCAAQKSATLPLLTSGKGLDGKEISASPSALFADAVRCAALAHDLGDSSGADAMRDLTAIVQQPDWAGSADLLPMQAALLRQQMVGNKTSIKVLAGHVLQNSSLVPRTVSLVDGTVVLVTVSVWSPAALGILRDLTQQAPSLRIVAITSWNTNTGLRDVPTPPILQALREFQQTLPRHLQLLIVPQSAFDIFHADTSPTGIVIHDGTVVFNGALSGKGAERMLLRASAAHTHD
jgi:hypothetical protein